MKRVRGILTILVLMAATTVMGQTDITNQQVLWTKYHVHWKVSDKWSINNFGDERTFLSPVRRHMFLGYIGGVRKLNDRWSGAVEFQFARFTLPHDPEVKSIINRWELRPTQSVSYSRRLSESIKLTIRTALEERFFRPILSDGSVDTDSYEFHSLRLRARIGVAWKFRPKLTLNVAEEFMFHEGPEPAHFFDQNRINGTISYRFSKVAALEAGYLNWFQRRADPDEYFSRHSWRLNLHLYFG